MNKKERIRILPIVAICFCQLYAQPPATYDLRTVGWVTPVKAQKSGTCWAHATASALESDLLKTGNWKAAGETGDPNMAEYHLSWWMGFNKAWNGDFGAANPSGQTNNNWGDFKMFCSYMSRLEGCVREIDAPGDDASSIPLQNQMPLYKESYHRWYVQDINWYYIDGDGAFGNLMYIDSIKYEIMRDGICPTNYLCTGAETQTGTYNGLATHYQPASSAAGPNHNVGIIGWDDSAATRYTKKGAWLCKNSWGPGSTPYLWISYWDKNCCRHIDESCVSFRNVQPLKYKSVYSHDYHGWRGSLKTAKECFNKFSVTDSAERYLVDVSFFTLSVDEEYEIKVYDSFTNGSLQDELAFASGTFFPIGYHTVKLNRPVTLKKGDDFYIYLKVKKGALAYDRTSSPFNPLGGKREMRADALVPSKAAADQSYYRTDPSSAWTDLFTYQESITVNSQSVDCKGTHNFCIKGFAIDTMPTGIQPTPLYANNSRFNLNNYPNPFSTHTTIQFSVPQNGIAGLSIFTVGGKMVRSFTKKNFSAGTYTTGWNGRDQSDKVLAGGVYYAVLTVKSAGYTSSEKKKLFMLK